MVYYKFSDGFALVDFSICLMLFQTSAYLEIEVQTIEQLSDTKLIDYTGLKVRKSGGRRRIEGKGHIITEIDNTFIAKIVAYKKQGGGYRIMPYKLPEKAFCDFHSDDEFFYPEFAKYTDFTDPLTCPLPKVS
jgi:hypothetical protein